MLKFQSLAKILQDDVGATAIEYSLIAAAIGLTIIPVLGDVNTGVLGIYGTVMGLFDGF
jgi:Flp pilus assembly pilin Flp